jgi:hypothetical protein
MRRWFVIALIMLLPWRALAADAMTLAMSGTPGPSSAAVSPHCDDHSATDQASVDTPNPHALCDVCNGTVIAGPMPPSFDPAPLPQSLRDAGPVRFASALPRAGHKPPIS